MFIYPTLISIIICDNFGLDLHPPIRYSSVYCSETGKSLTIYADKKFMRGIYEKI